MNENFCKMISFFDSYPTIRVTANSKEHKFETTLVCRHLFVVRRKSECSDFLVCSSDYTDGIHDSVNTDGCMLVEVMHNAEIRLDQIDSRTFDLTIDGQTYEIELGD